MDNSSSFKTVSKETEAVPSVCKIINTPPPPYNPEFLQNSSNDTRQNSKSRDGTTNDDLPPPYSFSQNPPERIYSNINIHNTAQSSKQSQLIPEEQDVTNGLNNREIGFSPIPNHSNIHKPSDKFLNRTACANKTEAPELPPKHVPSAPYDFATHNSPRSSNNNRSNTPVIHSPPAPEIPNVYNQSETTCSSKHNAPVAPPSLCKPDPYYPSVQKPPETTCGNNVPVAPVIASPPCNAVPYNPCVQKQPETFWNKSNNNPVVNVPPTSCNKATPKYVAQCTSGTNQSSSRDDAENCLACCQCCLLCTECILAIVSAASS